MNSEQGGFPRGLGHLYYIIRLGAEPAQTYEPSSGRTFCVQVRTCVLSISNVTSKYVVDEASRCFGRERESDSFFLYLEWFRNMIFMATRLKKLSSPKWSFLTERASARGRPRRRNLCPFVPFEELIRNREKGSC